MENFNAPSSSSAAPGQAHSGPWDPITHPKPRQSRRAITDGERKDLRVHKQALMQEHGKWTTNQMVDFFYKKYERVLDQSTISRSLSDTFKHLDEVDHPVHPDSKKQRTSYWPDLDAAVFDWQQQMLRKKKPMTDEAIRELAKKIFYQLPQYQNVEAPRFSSGWLKGYKARYKWKSYVGHDESDAVDRLVAVTELEDLRKDLKSYECEDIYSMNEAVLFWKRSPDATLASESQASGKPEKAIVTVALACNVTGTRKLPAWFIGKAETPRCFDRSGVNVENLPIVWRYNGMAWMTAIQFEEYLRWFDEQMAGRKVCLLLDDVSAHTTGMIFLHSLSPEGLTNTKVHFLPTNPTSVCQPLEQGIIQAWKAHYRRTWLTYMCNRYGAGRDPMKSMNILQAIRWGITAWEDDITPATIQNCWIKSGVLGSKYRPQTEGWKKQVDEDNQILEDTMTQIEQRIQYLVLRGRIKTAMDAATFVNAADEFVDDNDEGLSESLTEAYSMGGAQRDHETDEEDVAVAPIEKREALLLLTRLRLYEEQQMDGDEVVISQLNRYEREILARAVR